MTTMTFAIVPAATYGAEIAVLVPAQAPSVAAALSPEAVAEAKAMLADRGWCDAYEVAEGEELIALLNDGLASQDIYVCEVCTSRITTRVAMGGIAVCDHCGE